MSTAPFKHLTVLQFAKLLPGIDRGKFRAMFEDPFGMFLVAKGPGVRFLERKRIKGQRLTMSEVAALHERRRVDARAAGAILRLYAAGALPMLTGELPVPVPVVEAYVADAEVAERAARERVERAAALRRGYLEDPSTVPEAAFGIGLLNDIFMRHHGPGGGTLEIGGIAVTKTTPHRHVSNSGKSQDWSYQFLWTSGDGTSRCISRESDHADNRGSDPDRNWGLGRE